MKINRYEDRNIADIAFELWDSQESILRLKKQLQNKKELVREARKMYAEKFIVYTGCKDELEKSKDTRLESVYIDGQACVTHRPGSIDDRLIENHVIGIVNARQVRKGLQHVWYGEPVKVKY
ncbi:MAG: hypothetical protein V1725_05695 [archaeon]